MKTGFSVFRKIFLVGFLFLAVCQTNGDTQTIPLVIPSAGQTSIPNMLEGDIHTKCYPDEFTSDVNAKFVGAYFSLSNINRNTGTAKAQIIPYFFEVRTDVFTLRLSDKKKYGYAKLVTRLLQLELRNSPISKFHVVNDNVNIRRGPGTFYPQAAKPLKYGRKIIGRGPIQGSDNERWLQVIKNKKIIGYSAWRFFEKFQDITHPPTYNLDCRRRNSEEKIKNSHKVFPKFDVRLKSSPPGGGRSYSINLTDRVGPPLPINPMRSKDGNVKLHNLYETIKIFFAKYVENTKGISENGIKFVFSNHDFGFKKGTEVQLLDDYWRGPTASETVTRQASRSKRGQPRPKFFNQPHTRRMDRDLLLREEPYLDLPQNRHVLRDDRIVITKGENGQWAEYRPFDVLTGGGGKVIGYHWLGKSTPIQEGGSNRKIPTAEETEGTVTQKRNEIVENLKLKPPARFRVFIELPQKKIYQSLSNTQISLDHCELNNERSIDEVYIFECKKKPTNRNKLKVLDYEAIDIENFDPTEGKIKKFAEYQREISSKELRKPYLITFPTRAMLFYEAGNLNWKKEARKALENKKSGTVLKILLSANEISKGVPFSVPGDKNNTCRKTIPGERFNKTDLGKIDWEDLPCVVQTFVNKTGIPNLLKKSSILGCEQRKVLGNYHLCLKKPKKNTYFLPKNKGWARIPGAPKNETTSINKTMLRPVSPISSTDPWLRKTRNSQDLCNIIPHYKIVNVRYCDRNGYCPTKPWGKIAKDKLLKLPSLKEIDWRFKYLPSKVQFQFENITGKGFQKKPKKPVNIGKKTKLSSLIRRQTQELILGPAIINDFGNIPADTNAKFALFESKKLCDSAVKTVGKYWRPYHENYNSQLEAHRCIYAKILKGRESLSQCVLPKRDGKNWVYSFVKDKFRGKRHVILITDAKEFRGTTARTIRKELTNWLYKIKQNNAKKPVTVMQIRDDGIIQTVIRAEDLKGLEKTSKNEKQPTIKGFVSKLRFSGEGFRPLEHLVDFEAKIGSDLISVLYITAQNGIPADEFVKNSQLGTTLGWSADKTVKFGVYSTGRCDFWTKKARADACTTLKNKGANLKPLLEKLSK